MTIPRTLSEQMGGKTDQQLQDLVAEPAGWSQEALDAAKAELQQRNLTPIDPTPPETGGYQLMPRDRRHRRPVTSDFILCMLVPGWGVLVGAIAWFIKGEKTRGKTMMTIGFGIFLLLGLMSFLR